MGNLYRGEQKINLNLSIGAYNKVVEDMHVFWGKDNFSGFINQIIKNYAIYSKAAISNRVEDYCSELSSRAGKKLSDDVRTAINRIANAYGEELVHEMNSFDKGYTCKVRLNNENYDYLYNLDDGGKDLTYYRNSVGRFVKAIVEDYARLHTFERERVIYKELFDVIENAINTEKMIKIRHIDYSGNENIINVKTYKIMQGQGNNHWYLVGLSIRVDSEPQIMALRVSRIGSVKTVARSGKVTLNEQKRIEEEIQRKSVQYLIGDSQKIVVRLNKDGLKMYRNKQHLRPLHSSIVQVSDSEYDLTFDCTELQIKHYFVSFCDNAKVLSPSILTDYFSDIYAKANKKYSSFLPDA